MERTMKTAIWFLILGMVLGGAGPLTAQLWVPDPASWPAPQEQVPSATALLESRIEAACEEIDPLAAQLESNTLDWQPALAELLQITLQHCQTDPAAQRAALSAALRLAAAQEKTATPANEQERLIRDLRESNARLTAQRNALLESNNQLQFTIIQARQKARSQQNLASMRQAIAQLEQQRPSDQTYTLAPPQPEATANFRLEPALDPLPIPVDLQPQAVPQPVQSPLLPQLTPQPDEGHQPVDHQLLQPLALEDLPAEAAPPIATESLLEMMRSLQDQYRQFERQLRQLQSIHEQQQQLETELQQQMHRLRSHGVLLQTLQDTLQPARR